MSTAPDTNATVQHAPDRQRYELLVDDKLAGFTEYRDDEGRRVFFHTEIDDAYAGRGLSGILVSNALEDVRRSGLRVVGVCPLVAKYLSKHSEYDFLADPVTPAILEFIKKSTS